MGLTLSDIEYACLSCQYYQKILANGSTILTVVGADKESVTAYCNKLLTKLANCGIVNV